MEKVKTLRDIAEDIYDTHGIRAELGDRFTSSYSHFKWACEGLSEETIDGALHDGYMEAILREEEMDGR